MTSLLDMVKETESSAEFHQRVKKSDRLRNDGALSAVIEMAPRNVRGHGISSANRRACTQTGRFSVLSLSLSISDVTSLNSVRPLLWSLRVVTTACERTPVPGHRPAQPVELGEP
jgi:hypothetical protein